MGVQDGFYVGGDNQRKVYFAKGLVQSQWFEKFIKGIEL